MKYFVASILCHSLLLYVHLYKVTELQMVQIKFIFSEINGVDYTASLRGLLTDTPGCRVTRYARVISMGLVS